MQSFLRDDNDKTSKYPLIRVIGIWLVLIGFVITLATIHFLLFIPVHGRVRLYLSVLCTILPITGIFFKDIPFLVFGILDGLVKIIFGLYLFLRYDAYLTKGALAGEG